MVDDERSATDGRRLNTPMTNRSSIDDDATGVEAGRTALLAEARVFLSKFFHWYHFEHRHSGIRLMVPADVHNGYDGIITNARASVLCRAYRDHSERFMNKISEPPKPAESVWINRQRKPASPGRRSMEECLSMGSGTHLGVLWVKLALLWITFAALSIDARTVRQANRPRRVGPERPVSLSAGGFLWSALRTGLATLTASGSPQSHACGTTNEPNLFVHGVGILEPR